MGNVKEKILLVEDELDLAKALGAILKYSDYDVTTVNNGLDATTKTLEDTYNVIVMDVMMPVMDGITALKEMRKNGISTPVLLLTAKSQISDKVEGLDSGANDYLTKPFEKEELLARLRALSRSDLNQKEKYKIGNIVFDKENSRISNNTVDLNLNNKECEIMEMLIKNQERSISSLELKKRIWKDTNIESSAVTMYMSYLQDKFTALNANVQISDTNGYILKTL